VDYNFADLAIVDEELSDSSLTQFMTV